MANTPPPRSFDLLPQGNQPPVITRRSIESLHPEDHHLCPRAASARLVLLGALLAVNNRNIELDPFF